MIHGAIMRWASDEPPPPSRVPWTALVSLPGLRTSHFNLVPSADEERVPCAAEGLLTHFTDFCCVVVGGMGEDGSMPVLDKQ